MKKKIKRHFPAPEKVAILKRHLVDKVAISEICDELDLKPSLFYHWQKIFFENGAASFERQPSATSNGAEKKIAALEEKLKRKHEVLSELMEEYVGLKKELGEL